MRKARKPEPTNSSALPASDWVTITLDKVADLSDQFGFGVKNTTPPAVISLPPLAKPDKPVVTIFKPIVDPKVKKEQQLEAKRVALLAKITEQQAAAERRRLAFINRRVEQPTIRKPEKKAEDKSSSWLPQMP